MNLVKSLLVGVAVLFVTVEARPMKCNLCLAEVIELGKSTKFCSKKVMNDYSACYIQCATPKDGQDLYTTLDLMSEFLNQMEQNGCSLNGYYNNECHDDFRNCMGYSVDKFMDTGSTEDLCSIPQYKRFSKCGYQRQHENAYDICYFMYWKIDMVHKLATEHCPASIVQQFLILNAKAREESNRLKKLYRINNRRVAAPRTDPETTTKEVTTSEETTTKKPETPASRTQAPTTRTPTTQAPTTTKVVTEQARTTRKVTTEQEREDIEEIEGPPEGVEFFERGNTLVDPPPPRVDISDPDEWPTHYVERPRVFPSTPKKDCRTYGAKFLPKDNCHKYDMEVNGIMYKDLVVPHGTMFDTIQCSLWHEKTAYCGM